MNFAMYRILQNVACSLHGAGVAVAGTEGSVPGPRTITVALDGSGDFSSLQEAVDSAGKGDTGMDETFKDPSLSRTTEHD